MQPGDEGSSQVMFGFHDPLEHYAYELRFVYAPPTSTDGRGPIARLDRERSYWERTPLGPSDDEAHPVERSITFAQARRSWGKRLKFERFASLEQMRATLHQAFEEAVNDG